MSTVDRDWASFSPDTADDLIEAGWREVGDRMDRWAANRYTGDWQDPLYDPQPATQHPEAQ